MSKEEFMQFQSRMNAVKEIIKLNYPEKYESISKNDSFWAPEIMPVEYSKWINQNIEINPDNAISLSIYSLLMNMPMEQLKEKMIADFGSRSR